jgi:hypothetical protein
MPRHPSLPQLAATAPSRFRCCACAWRCAAPPERARGRDGGAFARCSRRRSRDCAAAAPPLCAARAAASLRLRCAGHCRPCRAGAVSPRCRRCFRQPPLANPARRARGCAVRACGRARASGLARVARPAALRRGTRPRGRAGHHAGGGARRGPPRAPGLVRRHSHGRGGAPACRAPRGRTRRARRTRAVAHGRARSRRLLRMVRNNRYPHAPAHTQTPLRRSDNGPCGLIVSCPAPMRCLRVSWLTHLRCHQGAFPCDAAAHDTDADAVAR